MDRRLFLFGLLALPATSFSQASISSRIAILTDVVTAIGAAGKAISDFTAGIKDLVIAGKDAYSYVAAARERDRLIDISRRTGNLIAKQNVAVVRSLDEYLGLPHPTESDWLLVAQNIEDTLTSVNALLADVREENGAFVIQDVSLKLKKTLASRSLVLGKLSAMTPPFSSEERALLKKASAEYKGLIANAEAAVKELNTYIDSKK
jgi:hypothetical protein